MTTSEPKLVLGAQAEPLKGMGLLAGIAMESLEIEWQSQRINLENVPTRFKPCGDIDLQKEAYTISHFCFLA